MVIEYILKEWPLHSAERGLLTKVSPELDPKILLDNKKSLKESQVFRFITAIPLLTLCLIREAF